VYRFWEEFKRDNPAAVEIIDDPQQDGFGLGLVRIGWVGGLSG
jgi:hypothetical protein